MNPTSASGGPKANSRLRAALGASALVAIAVALWLARRPAAPRAPDYEFSLDPAELQCKHDWKKMPIYDANALSGAGRKSGLKAQVFEVDRVEKLAVPGEITDVPEFHDCQKFVTKDGSAFEAMYAIFASPKLDATLGWIAWLETTSTSSTTAAAVTVSGRVTTVTGKTANQSSDIIIAAVGDKGRPIRVTVNIDNSTVDPAPITVSPGDGPRLVPLGKNRVLRITLSVAPLKDATRAVAQIYTYGPGYPQLGIMPNFNCLYVYESTPGMPKAKIVQAANGGVQQSSCKTPIANPASQPGPELPVIVTTYGDITDQPGSARWQQGTDGQYYIGLSCGNAWCSIGTTAPEPEPTLPSGQDPDESRVVSVRGWYDSQQLAIYANGLTRPTHGNGVLIPAPGLGKLQDGDFRDWVKTGYVALAGDAPTLAFYKKKFSFDPVALQLPLAKLNRLLACHGTLDECKIPAAVWDVARTCPGLHLGTVTSAKVGPQWWMRIVSAGVVSGSSVKRQTVYRCMEQRSHMGSSVGIPATARWRWVLGDETIWEECTQGCCEVQECSSKSCEPVDCPDTDTACQDDYRLSPSPAAAAKTIKR